MTADLRRAVTLLNESEFTCVLCKGDSIHTSRKTGISPMLDWLDSGMQLKGYAVADKIVGRAAALLFAHAGIREVYAQVLSQSALDYFNSQNIAVHYGELTPHIINRRNDGICPMEQVTAEISDPQEALHIIRETRERLRQGEQI